MKWPVAMIGAVLSLVMFGCSSGAPLPAPSPTPSVPADVDGPALAPDAPKTEEGAKKSAAKLMIGAEEIPGGGWSKGGPVEADRFRHWVCGVDIEPHPPVMSFIGRRVKSDGQAVLIETVRPIGATRAREIVRALDKTLETCRQDRRAKDPEISEVYTFDMERLRVASPGAVAYRQTATSGGYDAPVDIIFFAEQDSLVVFSLFRLSPLERPGFLDELVGAVRKKARG